MTFDEGFEYILSFTNLEKTPGTSMRPYRLDRMKILLEYFGNPQRRFDSVHVSGSKGKGSTALYIAASLEEAGYTTGLYTSPHVVSFRERITRAGRDIGDDIIVRGIEYIRSMIEKLDPEILPGQEDPTTFELLTLLSYLTFAEIGCDWAVIETGIGGRLDATNVLSPKVTVHTPIELEHTEVLGNTIAEVAFEKAGIMKPGAPAFCGWLSGDAVEVFRRRAVEVGTTVTFANEEIAEMREAGDNTADLTLKDRAQVTLRPGMRGGFQLENAALAFLAVDYILKSLGKNEDERRAAALRGIAKAKLPGRMELIRRHPPVTIDAAHTPWSASRLIETYTGVYGTSGILIFGSVLGKKPDEMAALLAPCFETIIISTPGTFKPSDPGSVFASFSHHHRSVELVPDPGEAYDRALQLSEGERPILVTGSFYMIAEIRPLAVDREYAEEE